MWCGLVRSTAHILYDEAKLYGHVALSRKLPSRLLSKATTPNFWSFSHEDKTQPKYKPSCAVCSRWNWICCVCTGKMAGLLPPHLALIFSVCSGSWAKLGRTGCVKVSHQLLDTQMPVTCQQSHVSCCSWEFILFTSLGLGHFICEELARRA